MSYFLLLIQLHSILCLTVSSSSSPNTKALPMAKSNCVDDCGGVTIPYPFGIGADCFLDPFFEIFCNHSFKPLPKPFLKHYDLEVTQIIYKQTPIGDVVIQVADVTYPQVYNRDLLYHSLKVRAPPVHVCESNPAVPFGVDFRGSPYRFSNLFNDLWVEGCSGNVVVRDRNRKIVSGCTSFCANSDATINLTTCHGVQCCQSSLLPPSISIDTDSNDTNVYYSRPAYIYRENDSSFYKIASELDYKYICTGSDFYEIVLHHTRPIYPTNTCTLAAALIDIHHAENITGSLSDLSTVPTVVQWHVDVTYLKEKKKHHVHCHDYGEGIQLCSCPYGYNGNPYLPNGCQHRDPLKSECDNCKHHCAYNETGYHYYCTKRSRLKQAPFLGFSTAMGLVLLVLGCYWLYKFIQWRREIQQKAKYFKRNGGLLLKQQMSSSDGVVEKMIIFSVYELEKATDNFHENRVLGQGGQGTVYKGMLMDGRIVAIKKSTEVDENRLDQFINEVVILSHINHRNVVRLLGCCLETEVPLLVYEFIPNGSLYQHIHNPTEDFHLAWKMRLQIAAESAGVLSYLHSSSSAPIYHRDIKSSNILLDEKFRAKVSDFGSSRAINIEQTHVTTRVQGTYGYVDPEYFQSNQFNEKSDVYSFGVVLVELITGKKPIRLTELGGWKSLATEFLCQMESSGLFDIVDARVIEEGKADQFVAVADLARQCLNMNGKERPTMKEVAVVLDRIKSPNPKEQTSVSTKCMATEINDSGPRSTQSTDMFFSANGSFSPMSIEAQPLMFNT